MLIFVALRSDWRAAAAVALFVLGWSLSTGRVFASPVTSLLLDLGVSVSLWWLYGPVSGAAFIAFGVVAVGPFLLDRPKSVLVVATALVTVPVEILLHVAAGEVDLPLFHAPGPVPTSEFLTGQAIQAALLLGVGALMIRIARMLRKGQAALAADLDRERELSTLKDRFVATVSHELRTPLTSLKGFTEALLENDSDQAERKEFLTIMSDQTEVLHSLIEDLITFSRIGAGGVAMKAGEVDLEPLAESVIAGFGTRVAMVTNEVPPGTTVMADVPRLRQILRNLVDNALKYGEPPVIVSAVRDGSMVRCLVLDAGHGIDRHKTHFVFEPYARLVDDLTMSLVSVLGCPLRGSS
jgi:signal transduction histidine kinase